MDTIKRQKSTGGYIIMNIKPIGSNQTVLKTNHGDEILYSYETPVAGFNGKIGRWFKCSTKYSASSSRHVNKYLQGIDNPLLLTPEEIENLFL